MQHSHGSHVHSRREGVVGGLGHVHIIVWMDALFAACFFQFLVCNMSYHFIHVHVALGAGAGLVYYQREFAIPFACQDFIARGSDSACLLGIHLAAGLVCQSGALLQYSECTDDFHRHFVADFEIFERTLRLRAPHMIGRNLDFS